MYDRHHMMFIWKYAQNVHSYRRMLERKPNRQYILCIKSDIYLVVRKDFWRSSFVNHLMTYSDMFHFIMCHSERIVWVLMRGPMYIYVCIICVRMTMLSFDGIFYSSNSVPLFSIPSILFKWCILLTYAHIYWLTTRIIDAQFMRFSRNT